MQTIVNDDCSVCPSVSLSRGSTRLHCAKTAEQIKFLFGMYILGGQRNIVLDAESCMICPHRGGFDATFAKLLWPLVKILFVCCGLVSNAVIYYLEGPIKFVHVSLKNYACLHCLFICFCSNPASRLQYL